MDDDFNHSCEKGLKIDFMVDQNSAVFIKNSSLITRILAKLGHSSSSLAIASSTVSHACKIQIR